MPKTQTTLDSDGKMLRTSSIALSTRVVSAKGTVVTTTSNSRTVTTASQPYVKSSKHGLDIRDEKTDETHTSNTSNASNASIEATLQFLERDTMDESWKNALKKEFEKPYFKKLKQFLVKEHTSHTVYPQMNDIYSWSRYTPLSDVKVVILGQDPYHNVGQAHGLSFSVLPPTKPPGSLKNIYKQIALDIPGFQIPSSGDLSPVAKRGVLWLNTSLTVRAHQAGSHTKKGWETFTAEAIRAVLNREGERNGVVFMAWGLPAQKTFDKIGIDEEEHLLLKSPHPSPLSAHRGFLGNSHFRLANEWLKERYGDDAQIDWAVLSKK